MPSISTSSSVLQRLTGKRQLSDNSSAGTSAGTSEEKSPSLDAAPETEVDRFRGHKRESSILSLPSSVTDIGHNVRRSVSLRSHRTHGSASSLGHKPRYPSSSNLLAKATISPPLSAGLNPIAPTPLAQAQTPPEQQPQPSPQPPRSRGKLSISARSLSHRFRSTDNLPIFPPDHQDDASRPPAPNFSPSKQSYPMLTAPLQPRRPPPDRPALAHQTSFVRDISTLHGNSANGAVAPSNVTLQGVGVSAASGNPSAIFQTIQETSTKRMATIDYFRKVHEGNVFYFSTLHYTPTTLSSSIPSLNPYKLGRRATSYFALGYSLPLLLDMNSGSPLEYLKTLCALLQEFETYQTLAGDGSSSSLSRARVGQMFKSGIGLGNRTGMRTGRRASAATDSIALDASRANSLGLPQQGGDAHSPSDAPSPIAVGHDFHHLLTPHLPFDPDFSTTFATLCDTLIDTYSNLLNLISGPDACNHAVGEAFAKADKAVRKILVSNIMREFEDSTRQGVKTEVAGLGKLVLGGLM